MRPIALQENRQFDVGLAQPAAPAWAHQYWDGKQFGATHTFIQNGPSAPRLVKHPPLKFDKGMAVDRFA
jgi:hypothetical protein